MRKQFGKNKIIILLGAGASCDAGLFNSFQMINEIERKLETDWAEYKDLYNYVQSSHFHLERIKGVPTKEIVFNIENLVGLLETISKISRKDLDIYPFVGSWEKELITVAGIDYSKAQKFKNEILKKLKDEWLAPSDFDTSSRYYKRLMETGYTYPLKIFSLNYDMCVEHNLKAEGISLERGFSDEKVWDYRRYDLESDDVKDYYLYKLHGSLDWLRDEQKRLTYVDLIQRVDPLKMEIIFGVQNKLQSYDPYLFYFYAFREASFDAELIITSGYGFMDRHINDNLINAFRLDSSKQLLVNVYDRNDVDGGLLKKIISDRLQIDIDRITVENSTAKEFFNSKLNVEYFSGLFPDEGEQDEVPF